MNKFPHNSQAVFNSSSISDRRNNDRSSDANPDERIKVYGRFMREDEREFPCRVEYIDELTLIINVPVNIELGEYLVCYLDGYGRIAGKTVNQSSLSFTVDIDATPHKRHKIVEVASKLRLGKRITELPRFSRMRTTVKDVVLNLEDNTKINCQIHDMSLGGALLRTFSAPPIGCRVKLGRLSGEVIRHNHDGVAIKFNNDIELVGFQEFFS